MDYLAKIAAWTVECPCATAYDKEICSACWEECRMDNSHYELCVIPDCKGSGRVLDPRFDGLRGFLDCGHPYDVKTDTSLCRNYNCPGYTINRDFAVLLDIMIRRAPVVFEGVTTGEYVQVFWGRELMQPPAGGGPTSLEAAAHAVYEWLQS